MTAPPFRYGADLKRLLAEITAAHRRRDDRLTAGLLTRAIALAPDRLDLRLDLAGRFVYRAEIPRALEEFRAVLALAPNDVATLTCAAHWARHLGLASESAALAERLRALRPSRAADLRRIWDAIDADGRMSVSDSLPEYPGDGDGLVVVVLGYALAEDGSMRPPMYDRLRKTRDAAVRYPSSRIVVSGGAPRAGRVEAVEMRKWLAANGVDEARIHEEGWSRDLVENLLYSRNILERLAARRALVVTSAINARRARVALSVLRWSAGSAWDFDVVGAAGDRSERNDAGTSKIKVYRDALRVYGIPLPLSPPGLRAR
ncbi:MAG: YdcF family protein [Planctomycetota bacterium]|jgi:hypothetical protein|nr:YdcF family protein [Planctomycetota bacterium]